MQGSTDRDLMGVSKNVFNERAVMNSTEFLDRATRISFFTGKGGVGKTSLACATAVALAGRGKQVLLVSTDPASNLDEVLGIRLSGEAAEVPGTEGLRALNIDPEIAAQAYRDRVVGPYRAVLPKAALDSMEEQLSGACTDLRDSLPLATLPAPAGQAEDADAEIGPCAPFADRRSDRSRYFPVGTRRLSSSNQLRTTTMLADGAPSPATTPSSNIRNRLPSRDTS
jgi:hypothetical protein